MSSARLTDPVPGPGSDRRTPASLSRRRLLTGLAAAPVLTTAAGARAFTIEPLDPAAAEAYRTACTARHPAYHEELVDELVAELRDRGVETDRAAVRQALSAASCPLCGCTLAALPEGPSGSPAPSPPRS
jgi:hypothetical protein